LATLKIPEHYQSGLSLLANMSDDSFEKLLGALKRAPSTFITKRELSEWIMSEEPTIAPAEIEKIIEVLTSFYRVRVRSDVPITKMVEDIASTIRKSSLDLTNEAVKLFEGRLSSSLVLESLNVVEVKAKELQMQDERLLLQAQIFTDLRPVFGEKISGPPYAMVVTQSLKLTYYESPTGSPKEIYIALDSKDIKDMKATLERAEEKALRLKDSLNAAGIRIIDLE
jgi:DNA mismatch repair ATPase MutS